MISVVLKYRSCPPITKVIFRLIIVIHETRFCFALVVDQELFRGVRKIDAGVAQCALDFEHRTHQMKASSCLSQVDRMLNKEQFIK